MYNKIIMSYPISPLDGRYAEILKGSGLEEFSEIGLMKQRVRVECCYYDNLIAELSDFDDKFKYNPDEMERIEALWTDFSEEDFQKIKDIEKVTNHDVKAVEYFLRSTNRFEYPSMIHFGLTSDDINSLANTLIIQSFVSTKYDQLIDKLIGNIEELADKSDIKSLSFTHGQAATPKTMRDRLKVFSYRLSMQRIDNSEISVKFGGSVGNLDSHKLIYPEIDWNEFMDHFTERLSRDFWRQDYTSQIDNYDDLCALFQNIMRINTIIYDLTQDLWLLIFKKYFRLKSVANEVGSSAMPHKVNPIDFEQVWGNIRLSNALFATLSNSMPISMLERDISGSTMMRNVGVAFAHSVLAIKSAMKGISKLEINSEIIKADLLANPEVVSEVVQNFMRSRGITSGYERVKELTRGKEVVLNDFIALVDDTSEFEETDKSRLKEIINTYLL